MNIRFLCVAWQGKQSNNKTKSAPSHHNSVRESYIKKMLKIALSLLCAFELTEVIIFTAKKTR